MKKIFLNIVILILLSGCATISSKTFVTDYKVLLSNKMKIHKGNKELNKAKLELIKEADAILTKKEVYSVTYKQQFPPSKSKNDYYTIAPYWWPDDTKPKGSPYIRKDGKVNPESRKITDSYMLGRISTDIYKLGLAYFYTEDDKYVKWINKLIAVFFIDSETKMNPNLKYAQIINGKRRPEGGSITIGSVSFIRLIEGVQLAQESKVFDKQQLKELKKWFADFTHWLENEKATKTESKAQNNIGVYYTAQVVTYNIFIGNELEAKKTIEIQGKEIVEKQIGSDGSLEAEIKRATPWGYVKYTITAFDYLVQLSNKLDVDLYHYKNSQGGSIDKMYKWLIPYAQKKQKWEYSKENPSSTQVQRVLLRSNISNYKTGVENKIVGMTYLEILTNNIY